MKLLLSILLSVLTTYHQGVYQTMGEVEFSCSPAEANAVLDSIMSDFEHNPHHVWTWMFYGTGEQKDERKQGFVIHYDSVRYDVPSEILYVDLTLLSPRGKASNLHAEPTLSDSRRENGIAPEGHRGVGYESERSLYFGVQNFRNMIKYCDATLTLTPSDNGTQRLQVVTHCKFGWFFNLFISRKMYRNTVEWRVEQFLENLRCKAEGKPLRQINVELEK